MMQLKWNMSKAAALVYLILAARPSVAQRSWGLSLRGSLEDNFQPSILFGGVGAAPATSLSRVTFGSSDSLDVTSQGRKEMSFSSDAVQLPHMDTTGELTVAAVTTKGIPQWRLWDLDTFDVVDSDQWLPLNDRGFCGAPDDKFLGGHCRFAAVTVKRAYKQLPVHSRVRITARVHFIDEWEGESLSLLVNDNPVWSQSHHWCPCFFQDKCAKYGLDTCGRETPDRLSVKVEALFDHSSPLLEIGFNSSLPHDTDACRVSWGIDDISVELL